MSELTATQLSLQDTTTSIEDAAISIPRPEGPATAAAVKDIAFGSVCDYPEVDRSTTDKNYQIAGMVGKVIEYPFDTVKVRLQSQPEHGPLRYTGPLDCFRQSLREGGFASLYRGISAPMFGAAVETSSLFFSYRLAQKAMVNALGLPVDDTKATLPFQVLLLCGAASGAFTSALLTPIELVKCQMQVPTSRQSPSSPRNPLAVMSTIYRHNGISGFWRGQLGTLIRETGGSAAWFGSYEGVCAAFRKYGARNSNTPDPTPKAPSQPVWQQLLGGASAGMAYNFICYPADTIKSRMQTEEVGGASAGVTKRTFWRVGRDLWAQQGVQGMYRGCGITVARAAPSSAFIFAVYETLLKWWK